MTGAGETGSLTRVAAEARVYDAIKDRIDGEVVACNEEFSIDTSAPYSIGEFRASVYDGIGCRLGVFKWADEIAKKAVEDADKDGQGVTEGELRNAIEAAKHAYTISATTVTSGEPAIAGSIGRFSPETCAFGASDIMKGEGECADY